MLTAMLSGVEALAPALALELAPVRVNAVTPGLIDTPLLHTAYGAERDTIIKHLAAILPGKCVGTRVGRMSSLRPVFGTTWLALAGAMR